MMLPACHFFIPPFTGTHCHFKPPLSLKQQAPNLIFIQLWVIGPLSDPDLVVSNRQQPFDWRQPLLQKCASNPLHNLHPTLLSEGSLHCYYCFASLLLPYFSIPTSSCVCCSFPMRVPSRSRLPA
ncbi:hypothetical protein BT63DRAFT_176048 [Microthyrium microscopicum]|uniref:Uncharacterized protein n=1 Tax=Microthyrium microscopicum TaxID=703497 RepID=A0A6A6UJC6_9PEZI|nr:hypothetical protein BT63DRAFT_176048 [Microthyrium microscopicum]